MWLWVIKWSSWWLYLAPLDSVGVRGALYTLMEVSWETLGLSGVHWGSLELNQDQWSLVGGCWSSMSVIGVLCGSVGVVVVLWLNGSHWGLVEVIGAHWGSIGVIRCQWRSVGAQWSSVCNVCTPGHPQLFQTWLFSAECQISPHLPEIFLPFFILYILLFWF